MKKILSLLIGVLLLVSLLSVTAFAADGPAVKGSNVTAKAGDTVTINFTIAKHEGFDSSKMTVKVDAPLSITGLNGGLLNSSLNHKSEKEAIVVHASTAVSYVEGKDNVLFSVQVKVADNADAGKYYVNLDVTRLNLDGVSLNCVPAAGTITVMGEEPKPTETEPTETEPTETQPTETEPTETKPTEPKPTEPKPTEPKPTEPKPTEPKPTEPKPTHPKPTEPKPTQPKPTQPHKPKPPKGDYDDAPQTGDITGYVTFGAVAVISMAAAAAYVATRKFAKK